MGTEGKILEIYHSRLAENAFASAITAFLRHY